MRTAALRWKAELVLVAIAFIWGATFVVVKEALADVSTLLFLAIRFSLAACLLALVLRRRYSGRHDWGGILRGGLVAGGLLFLGYATQTAGLRHTTASRSAFLTGLYIVLVPFFSALVLRNRPRWTDLLGAAVATAGTALLSAGGGAAGWNVGDTLTVACAFAFAAHMVSVEQFSRLMSTEVLSILQVAVVAAGSLATCAWLEPPRLAWSGQLVFALLLTAVFATALSFYLYTWAQRQTTANRAAVLLATEPVFAGLTAWAVAGEAWTAAGLAGAALILGGILVVELKPAPRLGHPSG
jgi:drug/metabolite transporter (DMT)-like permease